MDKTWIYARWNKPDIIGGTVYASFIWNIRTGKYIKTESILVVARGKVKREVESNGDWVSFWDDENVLELG